MSSYEKYTFTVGHSDELRLGILNRVCNPYTQRFQHAYLPSLKGKKVLDVGCGTGILSCYWAKQVGLDGEVTAVDISEEQIQIAKSYADKENLNNIKFLALDARELYKLKDQYDLVYCRFLLTALHEAQQVLKNMFSCVKSGGFLFCEEISSLEGGIFSDPDSEVMRERKKMLLKRYEIHKHPSPEIGRTLFSAYHQMGFIDVEVELCQPVITKEEDKPFFLLGFTDSIKKQLTEKCLVTACEFDRIAREAEAEIIGKPWLGMLSQHIQIVGKKP